MLWRRTNTPKISSVPLFTGSIKSSTLSCLNSCSDEGRLTRETSGTYTIVSRMIIKISVLSCLIKLQLLWRRTNTPIFSSLHYLRNHKMFNLELHMSKLPLLWRRVIGLKRQQLKINLGILETNKTKVGSWSEILNSVIQLNCDISVRS